MTLLKLRLKLRKRFFIGGRVLLLRFYLSNLYYLGWMRLQYDKSRNEVQFTPKNIGISRIVLMFYIIYETLVVSESYSRQQDDIGIIVFMVFLLITPKSVFEKQVRLINDFLRISSKLYRHCEGDISWHWSILCSFAFKVIYINIMMDLLIEADLFEFVFILPRFIIIWLIFMICHLTSLAISLLDGYNEWIRNTISSLEENLPQAIQQNKLRSVRSMRRKITSLLALNQWVSRITEQTFDCLGAHMALLAFYNLSFLPGQSIIDLDFKLYNALSIYSLKSFICALEKLSIGPQRKYFLCDRDWWEHAFRHNLAKPQLKIFKLVTPNRQLFFRIIFANCSRMYLQYMWILAEMRNKKKQI